jgi:hypothetical protein
MLAQLVEQRTFNPLVGGSSPPRPTRITYRIAIKIKGLASASPFSFVAPDTGVSTKCQRRKNFLATIHLANVRLIEIDRFERDVDGGNNQCKLIKSGSRFIKP